MAMPYIAHNEQPLVIPETEPNSQLAIPLPRREVEVDFSGLPEPPSHGGIAARLIMMLSTNSGLGYRIGDIADRIYPEETADAWRTTDYECLAKIETRIYNFLNRNTTVEDSLRQNGLELCIGKWQPNGLTDQRRGARALMAWPIGEEVPEIEQHTSYTINWR